MAKFTVLEKSFIDGKIHEEGAVIDFEGFPGANLEAMDDAGKKLADKTPADSVSAERMSASAKGAPLKPHK